MSPDEKLRLTHVAEAAALIADYLVAELDGFQRFDLQALRSSADNKPSRSSSRREAYVPQTA